MLLLLLSAASLATAESATLAAPYTAALASGSCDTLPPAPLGTCQAQRSAQAETGSVGFNLSVASPADGQLPGSGYSRGTGVIIARHWISPASARRVDFHVLMRVDRAETAHAEGLVATQENSAIISTVASSGLPGCGVDCDNQRSQTQVIASTQEGPPTRIDESLTLTTSITSTNEGPLPPGFASISIETTASAFLVDSGQVSALLDARILAISVAEQS